MGTATATTPLVLSAKVERRNKDGRSRYDLRPRPGKVRVFVSLTPDFPVPADLPFCRGSQKCGHFGPAGCGQEDHAAWVARYMRPGIAEQRAVLLEVLGREAFEDLGTLRFSKHAGCSMCPCSPGLVASVTGTQDIFVSAEVAR